MKYYVNKQAQSTGEHEVHREDCNHLPDIFNQEFVGNFYHCRDAIAEVKKKYKEVDGCFHCCPECHNR